MSKRRSLFFVVVFSAVLFVASHAAAESVEQPDTETGGAVEESEVIDLYDEKPDPVVAFSEKYVWIDRTTTARGDVEVVTDTAYFRGARQIPLEGYELYEAMGDEDLASSYRTRRNVRWGLMGSGLVLGIGGLAGTGWAFYSMIAECTDIDGREARSECQSPYLTGVFSLGATSLLGFVGYFVGTAIEPHPLSARERKERIDEHNRDLMDEYDLDRRDLPDEREAPGLEDLRVDVTVGGDGPGIGMSFRF